MTYQAMRWLVRFLARVRLGQCLVVRGLETVPRQGPLLACPNHFATLDPPLVPAFMPRSNSWSMAKSEWFQAGVFKRWLFTSYQAFPVIRHTADRRALRRAFQILAEGECLVVFPEGTRHEGGLVAGEPGAGYIAQRSAAAVVPVAVLGTRECLSRGRRWPRRVPVTISFGPPIHINQHRPDGCRVTHNEATDAIMLGIAELLPESERGAYSDLDGQRARLAGVYEKLNGPAASTKPSPPGDLAAL